MARRSSRPLTVESLEDRLTPASPGLLAGLVSPVAGLLSQTPTSTIAIDSGSHLVEPGSASAAVNLSLGLPLPGSAVQANLSLPLGGLVERLVGGLTSGLDLHLGILLPGAAVQAKLPLLLGWLTTEVGLNDGGLGMEVGGETGQGTSAVQVRSLLPDVETALPRENPLSGNTPSLPAIFPSPQLVQQVDSPLASPTNAGPAIQVSANAVSARPLPLPLAPGASAPMPGEQTVSPSADPIGLPPTTAVTGPIQPAQQPVPAPTALVAPGEGSPLLGGARTNALPVEPAAGGNGGVQIEQPEGDQAAFALEGADLATGFQPGLTAEIAPLLSSLELWEQAPTASGLHVWLLGVAAASALGTTWLACRRTEREALGLEAEDLLGGCSLP